MAATMRIALLAVAAMAVLSTTSAATTYTVGGLSGAWDLSTNYGTWVSDKKFVAGDSIVFKYTPPNHDVLEVSKADYDSCTTTSPIANFQSGDDTVLLSAAGTRYFICGIPGHCTTTGTGGMKVTIDVASGSSPSPPAPANGPSAGNSPPPSPPAPVASGPGASNSPPPPPASSAATSVGAAAGLGFVTLLVALMA